jgi:hypothetical protein
MVKFAKKQTCAKILWFNGKNPFPKASKCAELWRRVWSLYGKVRSVVFLLPYVTDSFSKNTPCKNALMEKTTSAR